MLPTNHELPNELLSRGRTLRNAEDAVTTFARSLVSVLKDAGRIHAAAELQGLLEAYDAAHKSFNATMTDLVFRGILKDLDDLRDPNDAVEEIKH